MFALEAHPGSSRAVVASDGEADGDAQDADMDLGGAEAEAGCQGASQSARGAKPFKSLCEAYSSMHKLDALLRHSDQRLKEAQAETLRSQLATRSHLRQLRERVGGHNVVMARNWDAFMKLCPAMEPGQPIAGEGPLHARSRDSVLPRISSAESDHESEDSDHSTSALAITDEEKLKLAALLRDLDQDLALVDDEAMDAGAGSGSDPEDAAVGVGRRRRPGVGYNLDAEARRSLENIDGKLQELAPVADEALRSVRGPGRQGRGSSQGGSSAAGKAVGKALGKALGKAGTRQQRLEDIDRCLSALADSALEDVEPVGEDEVQALLQEARGWYGDASPATAPRLEPALIHGLLQEARRELPRFRYRHHQDSEEQPH